ncbi:hypothetical protein BKN14_03320 [Candidatus Gracilibacteria bacterium HOT-871]|nr:hypothetical protein BKN14_03320 [Candidatus Gracilibacteria bacterium HOT-871]MBB1564689.1 hypothetical protein [Candidatus Gracilibacteria bacterium]RKW22446.1 MAG: hypothetical protein D8B46_05455 [Candidatus Gracilibacteria bacterium]
MKVKIYGQGDESQELLNKVNNSLEDLGLSDFMEVEVTLDENLKNELSISKEPALIIEEEAIDFKDTIFEGIIPSDEEIKSMFISIIGGGDEGGSGCSSGGCGTCATGCG